MLSFLAFPLHVLSSIFRFIFSILRIPVPQFRFSTLNFYRPLRRRPSHRGGPDNWVRELEEELGAVCISRLKAPRGSTSTTGIEPGPSRLTARNTQSDDPLAEGKKLLPDFVISGYEEFLRTCQRELKIGCVILLTEEHDDTPEFKRWRTSVLFTFIQADIRFRATLTNPDFVGALYNNDILVWGGDVRDLEAWNGPLNFDSSGLNRSPLLQPPKNSRQQHTPSLPLLHSSPSEHQPHPHRAPPTLSNQS